MTSAPSSKNRYVDIQIFGARASQPDSLLTARGLDLAPRVEFNDERTTSSDRIIRYGDDFTFTSKHGLHRCLLSEPLCGDIPVIRELFPEANLPLVVCKRVAKDVLLGIKHLHLELGVLHTGKHDSSSRMVFPRVMPIGFLNSSHHRASHRCCPDRRSRYREYNRYRNKRLSSNHIPCHLSRDRA